MLPCLSFLCSEIVYDFYFFLQAVDHFDIILLTKTNATRNEVAPSYHKVGDLYFQGVVFAVSIDILRVKHSYVHTKSACTCIEVGELGELSIL